MMTTTANGKLAAQRDEELLIGGLLSFPKTFPTVVALLSPQGIRDKRLRIVYEAIIRCYEEEGWYTTDLVVAALDRAGELQRAGGETFIFALAAKPHHPVAIEEHARAVATTAARRKMVATLSEMGKLVYRVDEDWVEQCAEMRALFDEALASYSPLAAQSIAHIVDGLGRDAVRYADNPLKPGETRGLSTGILDLDRELSGLGPGLYLIGAVQHVGKTAFCQQIATNVARDGGNVVYFSTEHPAEHLASRIASARVGVSIGKILRGLPPQQLHGYLSALDEITEWPLTIIDEAVTLAQLAADLRTRAKGDLSLVIVDNIETVTASVGGDQRWIAYQEVAYKILALANELDVPILVTMQIGEKQVSRDTHRPEVRHLYGSSGPSQAASVILLLHREAKWDPRQTEDTMEILIAKDKIHYSGTGKRVSLQFGPQGQVRSRALRSAEEIHFG